jgi:uroporphyrinogen decarboxylase
MSGKTLTPLERVLSAISFCEGDRVPFFLLLSLHGAKELGLSIEEYFAKAEHVARGQLALQRRYGHDCLYGFFYGAIDHEAFGGEALFVDDGPPNAGAPLFNDLEQIRRLEVPRVEEHPALRRVLEALALMKAEVGDRVPIIGVVMAPFSLPVMQLGFSRYFELLYERRELFAALMRVNEAFCVAWANAQLAAGATAICYFDPVCSPSMVPLELSRELGFPGAARVLSQLKGPAATHLASGLTLPIIDDLVASGTKIAGVSAKEDLATLKRAARGKLALLGNLNGIEMRRWSPAQAAEITREALRLGGPGGGFILSDNHGEIPWQVPDEVLEAIACTVREHGRYPLARPRDEATGR